MVHMRASDLHDDTSDSGNNHSDRTREEEVPPYAARLCSKPLRESKADYVKDPVLNSSDD